MGYFPLCSGIKLATNSRIILPNNPANVSNTSYGSWDTSTIVIWLVRLESAILISLLYWFMKWSSSLLYTLLKSPKIKDKNWGKIFLFASSESFSIKGTAILLSFKKLFILNLNVDKYSAILLLFVLSWFIAASIYFLHNSWYENQVGKSIFCSFVIWISIFLSSIPRINVSRLFVTFDIWLAAGLL